MSARAIRTLNNMQPWERQPEPIDTNETWPWFVKYRDMILPRNMTRLRVSMPGTVAPTLQSLMDMARVGLWQDRVRAWDEYLDSIRREEMASAVKVNAQEQAFREQELLNLKHEISSRELAKMLKTVEGTEMETLKPRDVLAIADSSIKQGRLDSGKATERIEMRDMSKEEADAWLDEYERKNGLG